MMSIVTVVSIKYKSMKIIEPKVELLSEIGISSESHIARCARVCYGKEYKEPNQEADEKMVEGLIKRGHLSMLRHASIYAIHVDCDVTPQYITNYIYNNQYWNFFGKHGGFASTNLQEAKRCKNMLEQCDIIDNKSFLEKCTEIPVLFRLYRLTFCITTQISTSRELNRKSPNAIAERSTRYCSSEDGLEICRPWWINNITKEDTVGINILRYYNNAISKAEAMYKALLEAGMKPEDARGILPLDTATKVIYTYSVQEWQHILDLRLYGTTGKPHPNAKLIAGEIRDEINKFAKEYNIDYQV